MMVGLRIFAVFCLLLPEVGSWLLKYLVVLWSCLWTSMQF